MKGETGSHPLFPLMPLLPHFVTIVGIPSLAICITAEQGATWPGCAGLGCAHTSGCIEHSP